MNKDDLKKWLIKNVIRSDKTLKQNWKRIINCRKPEIFNDLDEFNFGKTYNEKIYLIINDIITIFIENNEISFLDQRIYIFLSLEC